MEAVNIIQNFENYIESLGFVPLLYYIIPNPSAETSGAACKQKQNLELELFITSRLDIPQSQSWVIQDLTSRPLKSPVISHYFKHVQLRPLPDSTWFSDEGKQKVLLNCPHLQPFQKLWMVTDNKAIIWPYLSVIQK